MAYPPGWPRCACGWPALDGHLTCGRRECDEAAARTRAAGRAPNVFGGQFYGRTTSGEMLPIGLTPPEGRVADFWICRRVVDYAPAPVPAGGAITPCTKCGADVVFNPKREGVTAPKICMQCAHITPLPIES